MLKRILKQHPHTQPATSSRPSLGVGCSRTSDFRRKWRSGPPLLPFYPTPLLTKAPKVIIAMKKWVSITPTLTTFSKNEDNNKHKSWHSKQELPAHNLQRQQQNRNPQAHAATLHTGWWDWKPRPAREAPGAGWQLAQHPPPAEASWSHCC